MREQQVTFDPAMVETLIVTAPAEFTLHSWNPAHSLHIGGDCWRSAPSGSAPNSADLDRGRRTGNRADYQNFCRAGADAREHPLHRRLPGRADRHPRLGPPPARQPRHPHADRQGVPGVLARPPAQPRLDRDGAHRPRSHAGADSTASRACSRSSTPTRRSRSTSRCRTASSRWRVHNQVTCVTPFTLAGAMAPITLAGALVAAERRGARRDAADPDRAARAARSSTAASPATSTCSPARRRSARPSTGRRRSSAASWRGATTCRTASSNTCAANAVDAQAAYESMFSLWGAVQGCCQLHDARRRLDGGRPAGELREDGDRRRPAAHGERRPRPRGGRRRLAGVRGDRRGRPGRALLRHRPHPGPLPLRVLPPADLATGATTRRGRRPAARGRRQGQPARQAVPRASTRPPAMDRRPCAAELERFVADESPKAASQSDYCEHSIACQTPDWEET